MVQIEQVARAALNQDSLAVRSLAQDFLRENSRFENVPRPNTDDQRVLAISAALVELFASRQSQEAPTWTRDVGAVVAPVFLLKAAQQMKHLRVLCESESPPPLRKRNLYAPPNYLEFV